MSERLIVSHSENNHGGAVKRLNLMEEQWPGSTLPPRPALSSTGSSTSSLS